MIERELEALFRGILRYFITKSMKAHIWLNTTGLLGISRIYLHSSVA